MRAVVAEDVVTGHRLRSLDDALSQIVVIEQRVATGILRQRVERILRSLEARDRILCELAGKHADAAGRRPRRVAQRRLRHETAGIDRVQRNICANRRVRRRTQLRLVVDAVQPQTAGEVDERLLLGESAQQRRRGLQRRQLPVRIEDAELRIVLAEGRADIGIVGDAVAILVVAEDQRLHHLAQLRPIVGEILLHPHGAAAKRHDRQHVRRLHVGVDELLRGRVRARLVGRRHRRQIEIEDEQSAVAVACVARRRHHNLPLRDRRRRGNDERPPRLRRVR